MIDTVLIVGDARGGTRRAVEGLTGVREMVNCETGAITVTADLHGLHIRLTADGTLRVSGSLTKYAAESNVVNLTRRGVSEAVKEVAGALHLDATQARVYRVDMGATMRMPRPASVYLSRIMGAPRYRRAIYDGETVMLRAGRANKARRVLSFYDKAREAGVNGANLLRYECQLKHKVKAQLNCALALADLRREDTFTLLVERWKDEYKRVKKSRRHALEPTGSVTDLVRQFAAVGIDHCGGPEAVQSFLSTWRDAGDVSDRQFYRLKGRVNTLATTGTCDDDRTVIEELDHAVRRAAAQVMRANACTFE